MVGIAISSAEANLDCIADAEDYYAIPHGITVILHRSPWW